MSNEVTPRLTAEKVIEAAQDEGYHILIQWQDSGWEFCTLERWETIPRNFQAQWCLVVSDWLGDYVERALASGATFPELNLNAAQDAGEKEDHVNE